MPAKKISATAVAGNANTDSVVTGNHVHRVLYGQVSLTTDATVANRRVRLQAIDDGANVVFNSDAGVVVPASQSNQAHDFMQGVTRETSFTDNAVQVPIPEDFVLLPGWTLRVTIVNGVVGDSYEVNFVADEANAGASNYH